MSFLLKLERYDVQQQKHWPSRGRHILLQYDDVSVTLYGQVQGRIRNAYYKGLERGTSYDAVDTWVAGHEVGNIEKSDGYANIKVTSVSHKNLEAETTVSARCEKEDGDSAKFEAESSVSGKCENEADVPPPIIPRRRRTLSGKQDAETNRKNEGTSPENDFVWLQTSFVRKMYSCEWGKRSDHERILAVSIKREGFEEILRTYADDIQNDRESGDALLEWFPDRSLTGEVLKRFVPSIRITGSVLRQFYNEWVLGIKDISDSVKHQRRVIQTGNLSLVWTPEEVDYIPGSSYISDALGLTNDQSDALEEEFDSLEVDSWTETLAEAFGNATISEIKALSSQPREAILYLYGAFNPIHMGHVNAIVESKQWLENTAKYPVCETRIAIASDYNIKEKFSKSHDMCIKFEHRLKLCEHACVNHPWIKVSQYPVSSQPGYGEQLRRELNKPGATLVVLMGSDRAILTQRRVNAVRRQNKFILCIGRKGMNSSARKSFEEAKKNDPDRSLEFFVVPTELNDISSTAIRQKLRKLSDGKMKKEKKIATDLKLVREMIESNWISEEQGEYIFQNCGALYLSK